MRLLPYGLLLSAAFIGCQAHTAEAPPPAASPAADTASAASASTAGASTANASTASASTAGASSTSPAPAEDEAAASLREHHRHHHHGGVTAFIALALDTLGVDAEQREKIEKIHHDLNASLKPARAAEKELTLALADGIAAGAVESAKVDAAVARLTDAATGVHAATVDSLNQLHAILNPAQRAALVDKVQAHWEVWRKVNHEAEPGGREKGGRLAMLIEELALTTDQSDKISANLHSAMAGLATKFDPKEVEAHVQAFSTAFASDSFDAKTLGAGAAANGHLAAHGAQRMVLFYETVAPVLTAEQRAHLADDLREHLNHQQAHASN